MRLQARHEYDADPGEVFAMLTDEAFLRAKLADRGDTAIEVLECGPGPDGVRIVTRRTVALDVPGFARHFLRPANTVTQTDAWSDPDRDGSRTGTWQVAASGVPVTMTGRMELSGSRRHSVEDIDGTVSSPLPLVGGRLADFVGRSAADNLAAEHDFARRWLAGSGATHPPDGHRRKSR
jgi:hypothetical protein